MDLIGINRENLHRLFQQIIFTRRKRTVEILLKQVVLRTGRETASKVNSVSVGCHGQAADEQSSAGLCEQSTSTLTSSNVESVLGSTWPSFCSVLLSCGFSSQVMRFVLFLKLASSRSSNFSSLLNIPYSVRMQVVSSLHSSDSSFPTCYSIAYKVLLFCKCLYQVSGTMQYQVSIHTCFRQNERLSRMKQPVQTGSNGHVLFSFKPENLE